MISSDKRYGHFLSHPPLGEEIVITGISGRFPESNDVHGFMSNLFNKVDMITAGHRWNTEHPEIPKSTGVISGLDKFDVGFFGYYFPERYLMDPTMRKTLEITTEALFDAGLNPLEMKNTRTGVVVATCFNEFEKFSCVDQTSEYSVLGSTRSLMADRISNFFKLKGPSIVVDTACSSSLNALETAYRLIREDVVDSAIVGTSVLICNSNVTLQFSRLGILNMDGKTKVFDADADGYTRSESISVIILQKAKDAKRVYAQIVHAKTNFDGFKEQGITFPSKDVQEMLMREVYEECGINPTDLTYLEAHGTGTVVGDPQECSAIDKVFTKGRKGELHIGSVKSNVGHSEGASGLNSVIKCIIGFHTGLLPPNIHFKKPREEITGIIEKRLKVVDEITPLPNDNELIGVNSFGFGGVNCHVLLKMNSKKKCKNVSKNNLTSIVCISGRTEHSVTEIFDAIKSNKVDPEYVKLLHELFQQNIPNHMYRGYFIISPVKEICRHVEHCTENISSIYFIHGALANWFDVANELMAILSFSNTFKRVKNILPNNEMNILSKNTPDNIFCQTIVHLCIIDLIKALNIKFIGFISFSHGEIVADYFNDRISLNEAVKLATDHIKGAVSNNTTIRMIDLKRNIVKLKNVNEITDRKNVVFINIGESSKNMENDGHRVLQLFRGKQENYLLNFLESIGKLYCMGFNPNLAKMYPHVSLPVSNGTGMISPHIKWNHARKWPINASILNCDSKDVLFMVKTVKVNCNEKEWAFIKGRTIDGRALFPATGYLYLVWRELTYQKGLKINLTNVVFESCKFLREINVSSQDSIIFTVTVLQSGYFEIVERDSIVVTGKISFVDENDASLNILKHQKYFHDKFLLKQKDFYKELRLRGYHYKDQFKAVQQCNINGTVGCIKWENNWVTFMDNMLQMFILQIDTRLLYVPVFVNRMTISAKKHTDWIKTQIKEENENVNILVKCDPHGNTISSDFINVNGLIATSLSRSKDVNIPVLEKYIFIPNCTSLSLEESVRINTQIIMENTLTYDFIAVEIVDDDTPENDMLLASMLKSAIENQPLIKLTMTILSEKHIETSFPIENKGVSDEKDLTLVIVSKLLEKPELIYEALGSVGNNGFVISREMIGVNIPDNLEHFSVLTKHKISTETIIMLRKSKNAIPPFFITVNNDSSFRWIEEIQNVIKNKNRKNVVIKSECEPTNGILGFINCLRREPETSYIRCTFVMDNNRDIHYEKQLGKNMAINVFKDGVWGTYRHLLINKTLIKQSEHCFAKTTVRGDLSSIKWLEGPLTHYTKSKLEKKIIYVNYSSINFKDLMMASGRINVDVVTINRLEQEACEGIECSGIDEEGNRVCALVPSMAFASMVRSDFIIKLPDYMSLQDAATIFAVYATVIYGLIIRGHLKREESILIHSGTGGVGQAAITIALAYGCDIYTTVGTKEKREFISKMFPQIKGSHIGNSHDTSFEQMVYRETKGRGVDLVLNSLAEEKLLTSVRCLTKGGRFLDIGKFDLANNNELNMSLLQKQASFHGIILDKIFNESPHTKKELEQLLEEFLKNKIIRPLDKRVFKIDEMEEAMRYMSTGKHTGKLLIEIEPEEKVSNRLLEPQLYPCHARYFCDPEKTYIICGGLGGFGLELADWLILRGCRKLILTSRKGITTGYQKYRIKIWKSYGTIILISKADITTQHGCEKLFKESEELGAVDAIFNLAVILADSIFENQTPENFLVAFQPKAFATNHLDYNSRKLCPTVRKFVVFSSVSCGRGNAGQTNYGMANSVMERICEKRRKEGYPAVAIQWGPIGDVGLVAEMQEAHKELEVGGALQQRISNCLNLLDILLNQNEAAIVSSMVVAQKKSNSSLSDNMLDTVLNIIGIEDVKTVSIHATFAELGIDSMMTVEIKQTLEREFEVVLTPKDIRTLTLAKLTEIQEKNDDNNTTEVKAYFGWEKMCGNLLNISTESLIQLKSITDNNVNTVLCFPGIEGSHFALKYLTENIKANVYCLQYQYKISNNNVQDFLNHIMSLILPTVSETKTFKFVTHSFGCLIALEVAHILEQMGCKGKILIIDSSPDFLKTIISALQQQYNNDLEKSLMIYLLSVLLSPGQFTKNETKINSCSTWTEMIETVQENLNYQSIKSIHYTETANGIYEKVQLIMSYQPSFDKLNSKLHLVKASLMEHLALNDDYGLSKISKHPVAIDVLEGDHHSILENELLVDLTNSWISGEC